VQLPLAMFGIAVSVAILPTISRACARGEHHAVRDTMMHGLRQSFFLVVPAMAGLAALREPLVRLLFERGQFSPVDTRQAADALFYAGMGLLSYSWVKVTIQGFYAAQKTHIPVIAATVSMAINILVNIALVRPMGYLGLALSTTISYTVNFLIVYTLLCRRLGPLWDAPFLAALGKITAASLLMAAATRLSADALLQHLGTNGFLSALTVVLLPMTLAALVYCGACLALRVPEMRETLGRLAGLPRTDLAFAVRGTDEHGPGLVDAAPLGRIRGARRTGVRCGGGPWGHGARGAGSSLARERGGRRARPWPGGRRRTAGVLAACGGG